MAFFDTIQGMLVPNTIKSTAAVMGVIKSS